MTTTIATTIEDCVRHARSRLPRLEADVLAAHALAVTRSHLYAFPERCVSRTASERVANWVERRERGEPVAYVLGRREFWGLEFEVTPVALIPRPDTETLVAAALERIGPRGRVADLCTGCGAVGLAIASERPHAQILATDIDPACVELCRRNADRLRLAIEVRACDLFDGVEGAFDVIVANPPYVDTSDPHLRAGDLRFEPRTALDGGECGLRVIERLIREAPGHLARDGWLCIEHGFAQAQQIQELLAQAGFDRVACYRDLANLPRATVAQAGGLL